MVWRHPEVVLGHGLSGWPNCSGYGTVRQGIEMQMQIRYDVLICVVALMLWRADAAIAG